MGWGIQQSPGDDNVAIENTLEAIAGLFTLPYNNMALTYVVAGNGVGKIETVTTKQGAATVQTLTIVYDASNRISTLTVT